MKTNESGQGLTEYAVILSLVAVASIAGMAMFGGAVKGKIAALSSAISGQSKSEVDEADKISQKFAENAKENSKKTKGNTNLSDEIIDDVYENN